MKGIRRAVAVRILPASLLRPGGARLAGVRGRPPVFGFPGPRLPADVPLDFEGALSAFATWQQSHPGDPLGPASEAAGTLFSELNRLGILEAQFFTRTRASLPKESASESGCPHPVRRRPRRADALARTRIAADPRDTDALFALTLVFGLQADYMSLIENRNLAALGPTRRATKWAQQLLAGVPNSATPTSPRASRSTSSEAARLPCGGS